MGRYVLTKAADADIVDILAWTRQEFGSAAARRYSELIVTALRDAAETADGIGSHPREDLGDGDLFVWHLRDSRNRATGPNVRSARHFIVYRVDDGAIAVVRILHESMDIARRLSR